MNAKEGIKTNVCQHLLYQTMLSAKTYFNNYSDANILQR